mgnify:CR=1 FL=1
MFSLPARAGAKGDIPIIVKTRGASTNEAIQKHLMTISVCMKEKRSVIMVYRTLGSKAATERIVDPYGLVFYDGVWIVIGHCHLRKELRSFAIDRIVDLSERFRYFQVRGDFDRDEYLAKSWGVIHGEAVRVEVRFMAPVTKYILRKTGGIRRKRERCFPTGRLSSRLLWLVLPK